MLSVRLTVAFAVTVLVELFVPDELTFELKVKLPVPLSVTVGVIVPVSFALILPLKLMVSV